MCRSAPQLLSILLVLVACGSSGDSKPATKASGEQVEAARPGETPAKGAQEGAPAATPPGADVPSERGAAPTEGESGATKAAEVEAAAAEPSAPPAVRDWWCLCYARSVGEGQEPLTACRSSQAECAKLQRRVAKGGRGIVAKSLSHSCAQVSAAHPGDALGTREAWSPSRRPGAWLSNGACLFSDNAGAEAGDDAAGEEEEDDDITAFEEASMEKLSKSESVGPLKLGMTTAEVTQAVGEPRTKDDRWEEPATGDFLETWHYEEGLTLFLKSSKADSPLHLSGISIEAPSTFTTARGVGLGTSRAETRRIYADVMGKDDESMSDVIVLGSYYWGMFLGFEGAGVATIYFGDGAE